MNLKYYALFSVIIPIGVIVAALVYDMSTCVRNEDGRLYSTTNAVAHTFYYFHIPYYIICCLFREWFGDDDDTKSKRYVYPVIASIATFFFFGMMAREEFGRKRGPGEGVVTLVLTVMYIAGLTAVTVMVHVTNNCFGAMYELFGSEAPAPSLSLPDLDQAEKQGHISLTTNEQRTKEE